MKNNTLEEKLSKVRKFHASTNAKNMKILDNKYWPEEWKTVQYKAYARFPEVILPKPSLPKKNIEDVIFERSSTKTYGRNKISLKKISSLLYYSAGINSTNGQHRFYASAGRLFPIEIYVVSLNSQLPKGIYHYYVKNNSLEHIAEIEKKEIEEIIKVNLVKNAGILLILTVNFTRNLIKYGMRGYRYDLVEVGELTQNLYIISAALDLACCALGGFIDKNVNRLLDIDKDDETALIMVAVGEV